MSHQEFIDSRARGFTHLWPVAPEYRVRDGQVCALVDGQPVTPGSGLFFHGCHTYLPMAYPDLPGHFAKVATGEESAVLEFVRHYGLLGYAAAWRTEERGRRGERQTIINVEYPLPADESGMLDLERASRGDGARLVGDPLSWVMAHAETVKLVLDLRARLDEPPKLELFLDSLAVHDGAAITYRVARRGELYPKLITRSWGNDARSTALAIIAKAVNVNLTGISRRMLVEEQEGTDGSGIESLFDHQNLLDCIYWQLADAVASGWVRRCADPKCGAFFVSKSERAKYCPPPMGNRSVSPCMNRHKQRKHRERKRKEGTK